LRVSELTRYVRRLLEEDRVLTSISVMGEVTNLSRPGSGHLYFTLKDDSSQLACALMRNQALRMAPADLAGLRQGVNVIAEGSLTVYEPKGTYQLAVERIRVQGAGAARLRFEKLHLRLEAEGLFADGRKRRLPSHPKVLALVTAPGSQAYHDVIKRLSEQWPRIQVIMAGVTVQGDHAAAEISLALDIINRMTGAEIILMVRGGGAPEELEAFNDERVARAIFASRIPVVTGIGHTQDWTIADYVADVRAITPTAAASVAVPDGRVLLQTCHQLHRQMQANTQNGLAARRSRVVRVGAALMRASPSGRIAKRRQRLDEIWAGLLQTAAAGIRIRRRRLDALARHMEAVNPLGVLSRGYALLTDAETGQVVASIEQAIPGRAISARVKDGSFPATIGER